MKYIKLFSILLTVFVVCSAFGKKGEQKGVYLAGVSASFTDSLIYFTNINGVPGTVPAAGDLARTKQIISALPAAKMSRSTSS